MADRSNPLPHAVVPEVTIVSIPGIYFSQFSRSPFKLNSSVMYRGKFMRLQVLTSDSELLHIELRVSMQILDERAPLFRMVPFLMSVCTGVIDGLERGARSSAHSLLSGN